jgi:hypothetical protein
MRLKSLSARLTAPEFILNGRLATPAILTRCRRGPRNSFTTASARGLNSVLTTASERRLTSLIEYENLLKDPKGLA